MTNRTNTADFDTVLDGALPARPSRDSYELSLFHNGDRGQCDWAYEAWCDQADGILEELEPHRLEGRLIDLDTLLLDKALFAAHYIRRQIDWASREDASYRPGGSRYDANAWF